MIEQELVHRPAASGAPAGDALKPGEAPGVEDAGAQRDTPVVYESPEPLAADLRSADDRDKPSRTDTLTAQLCDLIGGPVGDHAVIGRVRFWTPMRVLMAFAVLFLAFSWFGKAACIQQRPDAAGVMGLDWNNGRQYIAMCYSDTVPLYGAEHLNEGAFPYKKQWVEFPDGRPQVRYMEYPVLSGLYQYISMGIAKAWKLSPLPGHRALEVVIYFDVVAVGLALAWLVTIWATALSAGRRVWDAALMALSPLVLVHAFTNFDTLATAFAAGGLLAWGRRRPVLAGILLGLGGAAKLYPLLLLGPILILCARAERLGEDEAAWGGIRPMRAAGGAIAAAAITWLAVNAPIAALYPNGWWEFFRLNTERHADPDSFYNVITSFTGWTGFDGVLSAQQSPSILNAVSLLLFLAACAGIGWIGLTATRRPRLAQLAFLVVAAFLLTNKVWSPQYSLWLVPLAVLALPQRRILLAWMTIDALVWVPRMFYYLGPDHRGLPEQWFTGTVVLRDLAVVALCVLVIRQIYHPDEDPVRRDGIDDPGGGILNRAPDPQVAWLPPFLRPRQPLPVP